MKLTDYVYKKFIASDTEVAAASTETEGTDFDSRIAQLAHVSDMAISVYVKGDDGGAAGDAEFVFVAYNEAREKWDTETYLKITVTINGATAAQVTKSATPSPMKLKLYSIKNPDDAKITANASYVTKR